MYISLVLKTQLICMCNIYIHLATLCTSYHLFSEWSIKPIGYMDDITTDIIPQIFVLRVSFIINTFFCTETCNWWGGWGVISEGVEGSVRGRGFVQVSESIADNQNERPV